MLSKIPILVALFSISSDSFCQKNKRSKTAPYGTVRVNDTLYVDKTEVANIHWREYLHYIEKYDSASIDKALPDTLVWQSDTAIDPVTQYYFRHPGFNEYPVVGVSYEQAVAYCQWRSDRVNELYSQMQEHKKPFKKVTYRLLTEKEWESIAAGNLPVTKYPYGYDSVYVKWKRKYMKSFNCYYPDDRSDHFLKDRAYYTAPLRSFFPNSSHTYNMIGNVAEMVSEKCIAKGGSFIHTLEECKIANDQHYDKPERWLGFRCIAIVVR